MNKKSPYHFIILIFLLDFVLFGCSTQPANVTSPDSKDNLPKLAESYCVEHFGSGVKAKIEQNIYNEIIIQCQTLTYDRRLRELYFKHAKLIMNNDSSGGSKKERKKLADAMISELKQYIDTQKCPNNWSPRSTTDFYYVVCLSEPININNIRENNE